MPKALQHPSEFDVPARPLVYDSEVIGIWAGKIFEVAAKRGCYVEQASLTEALEIQIYETQAMDLVDLAGVVEDFFAKQGWKVTRKLQAILDYRKFQRLLQESLDEAVIMWVEGYQLKPQILMGTRVAFRVEGMRFFGTVQGIDYQRGLYAVEVEPRAVMLLDDLKTVRKKGRVHAMLPWESVEAATLELKDLN